MGRACSTNGREQECIYDIGGKAAGKRPLERLRLRWVDNIKMDLREIGRYDIDLIDLAQWRALVNTAMNLRVP
jgi:hypothetical protein